MFIGFPAQQTEAVLLEKTTLLERSLRILGALPERFSNAIISLLSPLKITEFKAVIALIYNEYNKHLTFFKP